jgi:hypothetical protein
MDETAVSCPPWSKCESATSVFWKWPILLTSAFDPYHHAPIADYRGGNCRAAGCALPQLHPAPTL